jgi:hypothetical protein
LPALEPVHCNRLPELEHAATCCVSSGFFQTTPGLEATRCTDLTLMKQVGAARSSPRPVGFCIIVSVADTDLAVVGIGRLHDARAAEPVHERTRINRIRRAPRGDLRNDARVLIRNQEAYEDLTGRASYGGLVSGRLFIASQRGTSSAWWLRFVAIFYTIRRLNAGPPLRWPDVERRVLRLSR